MLIRDVNSRSAHLSDVHLILDGLEMSITSFAEEAATFGATAYSAKKKNQPNFLGITS